MPRVPDLASALPAKSTMKLSQETASLTNTESICWYRLSRWQRRESKRAIFTTDRATRSHRDFIHDWISVTFCGGQKPHSRRKGKRLFPAAPFANPAALRQRLARSGQAARNRRANCLIAARSGLPCSVSGMWSTETTRSEATPKRSIIAWRHAPSSMDNPAQAVTAAIVTCSSASLITTA